MEVFPVSLCQRFKNLNSSPHNLREKAIRNYNTEKKKTYLLNNEKRQITRPQ